MVIHDPQPDRAPEGSAEGAAEGRPTGRGDGVPAVWRHPDGSRTGGPRALSRALQENLARTAVEVRIPEAHRRLLDLCAGRRGVREATERMLREVHHPFPGWADALQDLHRRATGDLAAYLALADRGGVEAMRIFSDLYLRVVREATPAEVRHDAARHLLYFLEKAAREGASLPGVHEAIGAVLEALEPELARDGRMAAVAARPLRRLARALFAAGRGGSAPAAAVARTALRLFAGALESTFDQWLRLEDRADWWRASLPPGAAARELPTEVEAISRAGLRRLRKRLLELRGADPLEAAEELLALPDEAGLARAHLEAADRIGSRTGGEAAAAERIRWLVRVVASPELASVHEAALADIRRTFTTVRDGADRKAVEELIGEIFGTLRASALSHSRSALELVAEVGRAVFETGDPELAERIVAELLEWDFPPPRFAGFTEDWQVRVDPAHLRTIRAYLELIDANPTLARSLIAALVVHLQVGGVFIADTDLFQKDVSRLLSSDIREVYHTVKHLCRLFPVYFSDIGAEGELRDVSSRIDEITGRRDPVCHFLRKQCHVESNPRLLDFIDAVAGFWATGRGEMLRPYLPESIFEGLDPQAPEIVGLRKIARALVGDGPVHRIFSLPPKELEARVAAVPGVDEVDREKVLLLVRLRQLVGQKYELSHADLLDRLASSPHLRGEEVAALDRALREERVEDALEVLLSVLERLKERITSGEPSRPVEDIYRKRHIAVGIPSMYGRYREEKLEALGLSFRIESLAGSLFDRLVESQNFALMTRAELERVARTLRLLLRALRVDGCSGRGVATGLAMLEDALCSEAVSVDQYVNIFQLLSRSVEQLVRIRYLDVYEPLLPRILRRMVDRGTLPVEPGRSPEEAELMASESFLRDLISRSFGLQALDQLVGRVSRALVEARDRLDRETLKLLMSYDPGRLAVPIHGRRAPAEGVVRLGNKGYMSAFLARDGFPVPPGFILTTELFRCRPAVRASEELRRDVERRIREELACVERATGRRFGDPERPLLLSVRSGAAISMPGMLDTFLDVGINPEIAEGVARVSGSPWGAWDAYRRFLQFWGMGHGVERDAFDHLMREAKVRAGVAKKAHLPPDAMRELAFVYRRFLERRGVEVTDDPEAQLFACIDLVQASWFSEKAKVYRRALQIAEEWGTAVIVQSMVYGNLHQRSGTGVAMTRDPARAGGQVELYGDFVVQGQGEDVVGGLVETFPLSETQRLSAPAPPAMSLERDFPAIYRRLLEHANRLIRDHGMFHQEIEFTFESDDPADLYVLQTRDTVMSSVSEARAFVPGEELDRSRLAVGIGAGGGALSGRVAHTAEDIAELKRRHPGEPIVLLRPDTVPEDIPLILECDGLLTALGGATSHASVAAQRLGRTCVVGCRDLEVWEEERRSRIGTHEIRTGDFISINGLDGSVYAGRHPTEVVRRSRLV